METTESTTESNRHHHDEQLRKENNRNCVLSNAQCGRWRDAAVFEFYFLRLVG